VMNQTFSLTKLCNASTGDEFPRPGAG
jgi:hypothetical protein